MQAGRSGFSLLVPLSLMLWHSSGMASPEKEDGSPGEIILDGFGFDRDKTSSDEIQWMLDSGKTMEEIRKELGEEE